MRVRPKTFRGWRSIFTLLLALALIATLVPAAATVAQDGDANDDAFPLSVLEGDWLPAPDNEQPVPPGAMVRITATELFAMRDGQAEPETALRYSLASRDGNTLVLRYRPENGDKEAGGMLRIVIQDRNHLSLTPLSDNGNAMEGTLRLVRRTPVAGPDDTTADEFIRSVYGTWIGATDDTQPRRIEMLENGLVARGFENRHDSAFVWKVVSFANGTLTLQLNNGRDTSDATVRLEGEELVWEIRGDTLRYRRAMPTTPPATSGVPLLDELQGVWRIAELDDAHLLITPRRLIPVNEDGPAAVWFPVAQLDDRRVEVLALEHRARHYVLTRNDDGTVSVAENGEELSRLHRATPAVTICGTWAIDLARSMEDPQFARLLEGDPEARAGMEKARYIVSPRTFTVEMDGEVVDSSDYAVIGSAGQTLTLRTADGIETTWTVEGHRLVAKSEGPTVYLIRVDLLHDTVIADAMVQAQGTWVFDVDRNTKEDPDYAALRRTNPQMAAAMATLTMTVDGSTVEVAQNGAVIETTRFRVLSATATSAQLEMSGAAPEPMHVLIEMDGPRIRATDLDKDEVLGRYMRATAASHPGSEHLPARLQGTWQFDVEAMVTADPDAKELLAAEPELAAELAGTTVMITGNHMIIRTPGDEFEVSGYEPGAAHASDADGTLKAKLHTGAGHDRSTREVTFRFTGDKLTMAGTDGGPIELYLRRPQ